MPHLDRLDRPETRLKRNRIRPLTWADAIEAQVEIEGRTPQTWETAMTSDDADIVVIDGCWPLPPRGQ